MELSRLAGKRWIVYLFINKWVGCVLVSVSVPTAIQLGGFWQLCSFAATHPWQRCKNPPFRLYCLLFYVSKNKLFVCILFPQVNIWLKFRERTQNISWKAAQVQGICRLCLYTANMLQYIVYIYNSIDHKNIKKNI